MIDIRRRLKVEHEKLATLEEELAHAGHRAAAGDEEAAAERGRLLGQIEIQNAAILNLQSVMVMP